MPDTAVRLADQLRDRRSRKVVFLAHCLLNQNTRYLGGACRACAVREVVEACLDHELGIVQLPCPEAHAWGGVLKRWMLRLYGRRLPRRAERALVWLAPRLTRLRYRAPARRIAAEVEDYLRSGHTVAGIVGIDGSPSCGVSATIPMAPAIARVLRLDPAALTVAAQNRMVAELVSPGEGLFIAELRRALARRGVSVPFLAHDLIAELRGERSAAARLLADSQSHQPA